jgi:hypothetical protein
MKHPYRILTQAYRKYWEGDDYKDTGYLTK